MYCGILLANAGHTVTIYEASDRAGGRVRTYRDPQNPSIYMGDLGPMRLPLDAHPYVSHLVRERYKLNITEFFNYNPNAYAYINGIFATLKEVDENPDIFRFNTSKSERGLVRELCFWRIRVHHQNERVDSFGFEVNRTLESPVLLNIDASKSYKFRVTSILLCYKGSMRRSN